MDGGREQKTIGPKAGKVGLVVLVGEVGRRWVGREFKVQLVEVSFVGKRDKSGGSQNAHRNNCLNLDK